MKRFLISFKKLVAIMILYIIRVKRVFPITRKTILSPDVTLLKLEYMV